MSRDAMQGALMQSSQTSGYFLTRAPLDMLTDHPIQWPFQVLAPFIACQSEQSLPPKFSLHLCVNQRPGVNQGDVAVRNATITCPLPFVAIGDIKFQVQHVGLKGLERTRNHLPPVLGFLQGFLQNVIYMARQATAFLMNSLGFVGRVRDSFLDILDLYSYNFPKRFRSFFSGQSTSTYST